MDAHDGNRLLDAVRGFLASQPADEGFPLGGEAPIPTAAELSFSRILETAPTSANDVAEVRAHINNIMQAYALRHYAMRMAVYAVRTNAESILRGATLGFVMDDDLLDRRDVLIGLSIIEDAAQRLGSNIEAVLARSLASATDGRRHLIVEGYLKRTPEWRGLGVMGIMTSGIGDTFTYSRKGGEMTREEVLAALRRQGNAL